MPFLSMMKVERIKQGLLGAELERDAQSGYYRVKRVLQGENSIEPVDESMSLCGKALYEEHNIQVQRAIIDLLPQRYRLPQEW